MGGFSHSYKTLQEKATFHRKRAKYHLDRAADWERIMSEIQQLQRVEQLPADAEVPKPPPPKKTTAAKNRNDYARELLKEFAASGITPAEVRKRANEQGFATPDNFPYKMFKNMLKTGRVRKNKETGKYFPIEGVDLI
jgi:hypothetical protein